MKVSAETSVPSQWCLDKTIHFSEVENVVLGPEEERL